MTAPNPTAPPSTDEVLRKIQTLVDEGNERGKTLAAKFDAYERRLEAFDEALKSRGVDRKPGQAPLNMGAVVRGLLLGGLDEASAWKGADRERQIGLAGREALRSLPDGERGRVASVSSNGNGGYTVPPDFQTEYIDLLSARAVLTQAGVTNIQGIQGSPFQIPRLTGGTTASYIAETGTAITDSTPTWDQPSGTPHLLTGAVKVTRRLAALSAVAIQGVVNKRLGLDLALKQDETGLIGAGGAPVPDGILTQAAANITNLAAVPDVDDLYDMLYRLEAANANTDSNTVGFVMHPRTWNGLRKLRDLDGRGLITPDPTVKARFSMLGFPVYRTTQIPINGNALGGSNESRIFLGDWSDLWHLWWGVMGIEVSNVAGDAFLNHQVWVKAFLEDDWLAAHVNSFQILAQVLPG